MMRIAAITASIKATIITKMMTATGTILGIAIVARNETSKWSNCSVLNACAGVTKHVSPSSSTKLFNS